MRQLEERTSRSSYICVAPEVVIPLAARSCLWLCSGSNNLLLLIHEFAYRLVLTLNFTCGLRSYGERVRACYHACAHESKCTSVPALRVAMCVAAPKLACWQQLPHPGHISNTIYAAADTCTPSNRTTRSSWLSSNNLAQTAACTGQAEESSIAFSCSCLGCR